MRWSLGIRAPSRFGQIGGARSFQVGSSHGGCPHARGRCVTCIEQSRRGGCETEVSGGQVSIAVHGEESSPVSGCGTMVQSTRVVHSVHSRLRSVPRFLWGVFQGGGEGGTRGNHGRSEIQQVRAWKLLLLLPRMLLHRPPRGGQIGKSKLIERSTNLRQGSGKIYWWQV